MTMRVAALAFLLLVASADGSMLRKLRKGKSSSATAVDDEEAAALQALAIAQEQLQTAQLQLAAAEAEVKAEGGEIDEDGNAVTMDFGGYSYSGAASKRWWVVVRTSQQTGESKNDTRAKDSTRTYRTQCCSNQEEVVFVAWSIARRQSSTF